jgi:polar amino acid transport system permease protein
MIAEWLGYSILLLKGAVVTIELTILGCGLALIIAFTAGLSRLSGHRSIRTLATVYIEFFRGTSIFVQLFWAFFVLPFLGIRLSPFTAGVVVLGLNVGSYAAEVVRGAFLSIPKEQTEACLALNLNTWQRMRWVIFPQAFVIMLPSFGNNAIETMKGSAVVSLITITDLTFQAQIVRSTTGNTIIPFSIILIIYFIVASAIAKGVRLLERKVRRGWI